MQTMCPKMTILDNNVMTYLVLIPAVMCCVDLSRFMLLFTLRVPPLNVLFVDSAGDDVHASLQLRMSTRTWLPNLFSRVQRWSWKSLIALMHSGKRSLIVRGLMRNSFKRLYDLSYSFLVSTYVDCCWSHLYNTTHYFLPNLLIFRFPFNRNPTRRSVGQNPKNKNKKNP